MLGEDGLDLGLRRRRDTRDGDILRGREAEIPRVNRRDLAQRRLHRPARAVNDAAGKQMQAIEPGAVRVLHPTVLVLNRGKYHRTRGRKGDAAALLDLGLEPLDTAVSDGVFETRVLAVGAVAMVALGCEHRVRDGVDLLASDEAERIRQTRKRFLIAVAHAQPAADGHVVTHQLAILDDRDVAEILRVNIHVVRWRHGKSGLEFARQVSGAIHGLDLRLAPGDQLLIEPNLVVGAGLGQRIIAPALRVLVNLLQNGRLLGIHRSHDVAIHVAAGRDRIEQHFVHALDQGLHVALQHTVKLKSLPSGKAQRRRAQVGGELVQNQPLGGGGLAAGQAHAKHERVGLFLARLLEREPLIPVVLLVGAVKLDQLLAIRRDHRRGSVGELRLEIATQVVRSGLDTLVGNERLGGGGVGVHGARKKK